MAPTIPFANSAAGMFHTFQGVARKPSAETSRSSKASDAGGSKRITTPHACAECKRRKIRCDGQQPCGQCLSSRAPKRCFYDKHRQRVIPSRKTLEALSRSLEECRSIIKRLYPNQEVQTLLPLSRQDLLILLDRAVGNTPASLPSPPLHSSALIDGDTESSQESTSDNGLASLEQIPSRDTEWDEERRERDHIPVEADDVNALSLSVDRQASYLGASSIKAALMVMLKVQPALRNTLTAPLTSAEMPHNYPAIRQKHLSQKDLQRIPWSWKGQTLIDAYFKRIHVFVPMLDEPSFRADYLEGQRFDAPWLALVNTVFAMGIIAAMKSDDYSHVGYYNRAMELLPMDAFGSSHIESVQGLALIGGYYLHYTNRPNMANAVLGAAIRMASALGLHRESLAQGSSDMAAAETRRRTWWSLFCLDTWATTTMGRPSFGRWGPAINIRPPEFGMNSSRDSPQHAGILPMIENIKFCKIATQIQDMLAVSPLLRPQDRCNLDGQLVSWYSNLPWLLRTTDPCAEPLYIARCIMKWRYQNLRMLLHRPVLLSLASRGARSSSSAPETDLAAVDTCRELAETTIDDISREWTRNQMSGWNAVWFLYQAAMIPLVSIFWQGLDSDSSRVERWRRAVETTIELLAAMEEWSLAARRSREVVSRMYEASRHPAVIHSSQATSPRTAAAQQQHLQSQHTQFQQQQQNVFAAGLQGDLAAFFGEPEVHMSPISLAPEGLGAMGLLDQQGLWDLDGMFWMQPEELDLASFGFQDGMMQVDYGLMGSQAATAAMAGVGAGPGGASGVTMDDGSYPLPPS